MLRCAAPARTDVIAANIIPGSLILFTLMMEATLSSKISVYTRAIHVTSQKTVFFMGLLSTLMKETSTLLGTWEKANLNHWTVQFPELRFLVDCNSGWSSRCSNPVILSVIHHRQNPLVSTHISCTMRAFCKGRLKLPGYFWLANNMIAVLNMDANVHVTKVSTVGKACALDIRI
jgi:hypothetical protein